MVEASTSPPTPIVAGGVVVCTRVTPPLAPLKGEEKMKEANKAERDAKKRERRGHKPHTCSMCGKRLGMSQAFMARGRVWYKKHRMGVRK